MNRYLALLHQADKKTGKHQHPTLQNLQNPETGSFVGFEGIPPSAFEKKQALSALPEREKIPTTPDTPDRYRHLVQCQQCANLTLGGGCQMKAGYKPIPDAKRDCGQFEPVQGERQTITDTPYTAADPDTGRINPREYRFDDEAQVMFDVWLTDLMLMLKSRYLHPALESHFGKYRKLIPALALVCALADGEEIVGKVSLMRALAWSDYLKSHAERAYAAGSRVATEGAAALLAKIKSGSIKSGFSPRDVYLKNWSRLTTPEDVQAAATLLCDLHHLREIEHKPGKHGGRPTVTYQINPLTLARC